MQELPLEIYVTIALTEPCAWCALLAVSDFARWTMTSHARRMRRSFLRVVIDHKKIQYFLQNKLHNFDDFPAVIHKKGLKNDLSNRNLAKFNPPQIFSEDNMANRKIIKQEWFRNGKRHRDNDMPAIIYTDGSREWYKNGCRHRDNDAPAIIRANGRQEWWQNDKLHRDNDRPAVIIPSGSKWWYKRGCRHRDDAPAVICADGRQFWYKNSKYVSR